MVLAKKIIDYILTWYYSHYCYWLYVGFLPSLPPRLLPHPQRLDGA